MTSGRIVTCYSYKGGVGRSFALANLATILAQWQYRVLCVDWDLEAPGLAYYFKREQPEPGLLEMIEAVAAGERPDGLDNVRAARLADDSVVDLITAGDRHNRYATRVQAVDWERLYQERDLGHVLEEWRAAWMRQYDIVLIDSRTGITDVGGICTASLPDVLLLFFTANMQSVDGVLDVLDQAIATRNRLVFDRPRLRAVPVPSRFDQAVEYERSDQWRQVFEERFAGCYRDWAARSASVPRLLAHTTIPYSAYWSFGEDLPVLTEDQHNPALLSYRFATLAALLAHRLENTELLTDSRDSYVDSAVRAGRQRGSFSYDAYVSSAPGTYPVAQEIAGLLEGSGLSIWLEPRDELVPGDSIDQHLDDAQNVILVLGETPTPWQERETRYVLRQALDDDSRRRVIPVVTDPSSAMPSILQSLKSYDLSSGSVEDAAREIARALRETRN